MNFISCVCRDWGKGKGVYRAGRITLFKPACVFDGGTWYCIFNWSGYEKGGDCQYGIKCHCIGNEFLSGVFVPIEFLGDGIIKAAHFLPVLLVYHGSTAD